MASNQDSRRTECGNHKSKNETVESDVEICPYMGKVGDTMSDESDDLAVRPRKKRKLTRHFENQHGHESDNSSTESDEVGIKKEFTEIHQNSDEDSCSENPLGSRKVQDFMFNEEMKLLAEEEINNVCVISSIY